MIAISVYSTDKYNVLITKKDANPELISVQRINDQKMLNNIKLKDSKTYFFNTHL